MGSFENELPGLGYASLPGATTRQLPRLRLATKGNYQATASATPRYHEETPGSLGNRAAEKLELGTISDVRRLPSTMAPHQASRIS